MIKILDTKQLIELYKNGYFPMAENANSNKINFYKPIKRFIIPIKSFHIPTKLFKIYKNKNFKLSINTKFSSVIENCSKIIRKDKETWINQIIKETYIKLFEKGYAKSIECFYENKLVGGLYGIHIGGCFFGESMFSKINNASKLSLLYLISILKDNNFKLLDSQFYNPHLLQFGAYEILDDEYQEKLKNLLNLNCKFPNNLTFQKSVSILQSLSHKS